MNVFYVYGDRHSINNKVGASHPDTSKERGSKGKEVPNEGSLWETFGCLVL